MTAIVTLRHDSTLFSQHAEAKLRSSGVESCYLFRRLPSGTHTIFLSVLHAGKVLHLEFEWQLVDDELGLRAVGMGDGALATFPDLQAVEAYYKRQVIEQLGMSLPVATLIVCHALSLVVWTLSLHLVSWTDLFLFLAGCALGTPVEAYYATENALRNSLVRASSMT